MDALEVDIPRRGAWISCAACVLTSLTAHGTEALETPVDVVQVDSTAALLAAVANDDTPRHIHLVRGIYAIDRPLQIPDDTTLSGEGVMRLDDAGVALGFEPGSETVLEVTGGFTGDVLTLGNHAHIRGLLVRDLEDDPAQPTRRAGNVVSVASRTPDDAIEASIVECVIHNPNAFGFSEEGPTGHAIVVLSRNPGRDRASPPHERATLSLRLVRSVVHATPRGGAVFAINFAPGATIEMALSFSRFEGVLMATAGVSRPDPVTGARLAIASEHNRYGWRSPIPSTRGWVLYGGSSAPHYPSPASTGASFNVLQVRSVGDSIEGTSTGILAAAARRILAASEPLSDNQLTIDVEGLTVRTAGVAAADLVLYATLPEPDPDVGQAFPVGQRNTVRVRIEGSTGSGPRANVFATDSGAPPADRATSNRIEFVGDLATFSRRNAGFVPSPGPELFIADPGLAEPGAGLSRDRAARTPP